MRSVQIGPQDALMDLEHCYDALLRYHCDRVAGSPPWRLMKAQARQESVFNPIAQSLTGPVGLFQFTASTWAARRPGKDRRDIFENAGAAVEEMTSLLAWAEKHGTQGDNVYRFSLGAFNQGQGNIGKAMVIAANEGADPTQWGNIPHVLATVLDPSRTAQCVDYVNRIMTYWAAYEAPGVKV